MGNCLMRSNSKVSSQDHEKHEPAAEKETEAVQITVVTPVSKKKKKKKKKTVRFNLQEDEDEDDSGRGLKNGTHDKSKSGAVRIRLVVTQEELKQLLNSKDGSISSRSSVEQLLNSLKSRSGTRVSADQNGTTTAAGEIWRPVLESISEEQC